MLDPELAPRDQTAWAFTSEEDARAEVVPLGRKLNANVLRYLDYVAELSEG